jgi:hypothetical protein
VKFVSIRIVALSLADENLRHTKIPCLYVDISVGWYVCMYVRIFDLRDMVISLRHSVLKEWRSATDQPMWYSTVDASMYAFQWI